MKSRRATLTRCDAVAIVGAGQCGPFPHEGDNVATPATDMERAHLPFLAVIGVLFSRHVALRKGAIAGDAEDSDKRRKRENGSVRLLWQQRKNKNKTTTTTTTTKKKTCTIIHVIMYGVQARAPYHMWGVCEQTHTTRMQAHTLRTQAHPHP